MVNEVLSKEKALERRAEELERLEEQLLSRGKALDRYAEQVERRQEEVDSKLVVLQGKWTSLEASRLLASAAEQRAISRETSIGEEMQKFLREIAAKQKELAEMERERVVMLEEADRRLEESRRITAEKRTAVERLSRIRNQTAALQEHAASLREEERSLKSKVDNLQKEASRVTELNDKFTNKLSALRAEWEALNDRTVEKKELVSREDRVKDVEKELAALEKDFGEEVATYGSMAAWLRSRGRRLAEDAAAVGARERAVLAREEAVEVSEVREARVAEAERRLQAREQRVSRELKSAEALRAESEQALNELEARREAVDHAERNAAMLSRSLEATQRTIQRKEAEVDRLAEEAREERNRYTARFASIEGRESELDDRERTLQAVEAELAKREKLLQQEKEDFSRHVTEAERLTLEEKVERLRGVVISLDAPPEITAAAHALADEVAASPRISRQDVHAWEARLLELLTSVQRLHGGKSRSTPYSTRHGQQEGPVPPSPTRSSASGKEFEQFRHALNRGLRVEDIIMSMTTPAHQIKSAPKFPVQNPPSSPQEDDTKSAPAVLHPRKIDMKDHSVDEKEDEDV